MKRKHITNPLPSTHGSLGNHLTALAAGCVQEWYTRSCRCNTFEGLK